METNYLHINIPNTLTVGLMYLVFSLMLGLIYSGWVSYASNGDNNG